MNKMDILEIDSTALGTKCLDWGREYSSITVEKETLFKQSRKTGIIIYTYMSFYLE